jgi:hypothetical protein
MAMILNGFLFLCCVLLFIFAGISLIFGAFPLTILFLMLFSFCYWSMRWEGPQPKHHVIHFADDGDGGDEDEPEPEYYKPFNRENFKFN